MFVQNFSDEFMIVVESGDERVFEFFICGIGLEGSGFWGKAGFL